MKYKFFITALIILIALGVATCGCANKQNTSNNTNSNTSLNTNANNTFNSSLRNSLKSALIESPEVNSSVNLTSSAKVELSNIIVPRLNNFSFKLFKVLSNYNKSSNIVISPLSVEYAFATVTEGASGVTKTQMLSSLDLPRNNTIRRVAFAYLYNTENQPNISLANALWIQNGYPIKKEYISIIKKYYPAEMYYVNFENPNTVNLINYWVKTKTNGKIKNIFRKTSPSTKLVVINTIYFKGNWAIQFNKNLTRLMDFYVNVNKTVKVKMMTNTITCPYIEGKGYKAIDLPYKGNFSMVIFLSNTTNTKNGTLKVLKNFSEFVNSMKPCRVRVYLPKFEFKKSYQLIKPMTELGMRDAFTSKANFSNMSNKKIHIGYALHKTYIKLNENGTTAAAVTGIGIVSTAVPSNYKIFKANKPFTFFIVNKVSNKYLIVFMGKVNNPNA